MCTHYYILEGVFGRPILENKIKTFNTVMGESLKLKVKDIKEKKFRIRVLDVTRLQW